MQYLMRTFSVLRKLRGAKHILVLTIENNKPNMSLYCNVFESIEQNFDIC